MIEGEVIMHYNTATNYGKFLKRWEYQTTSPASWEICMLVKKQQLELDMEQQTGSKLGKVPFELRRKAGDCSRVTAGPIDLI